jgi:RHS repeat-associated protein
MVSVADDIGMSQGKIMMAAARFGLGARNARMLKYAAVKLWLLALLLLVSSSVLTSRSAVATDVDCTASNIQCVQPLATDWNFFWPSAYWSQNYADYGSAVADMESHIDSSYAPCHVDYLLNDEFPSLSEMDNPTGYLTGSDWTLTATMNVNYDVRWAVAITPVLNGGGPGCSSALSSENMIVHRTVSCPIGYYQGSTYCYRQTDIATHLPDKSRKPGCTCGGSDAAGLRPSINDPVDVADGYMWTRVTDVDGGAGPSLERNYNSSPNIVSNTSSGGPAGGFGYGWRSNYSRRVRYITGTFTGAYLERPSGQMLYFSKQANVWSSDADVHSRLTETDDGNGTIIGWTYFDDASGETEIYDGNGRVIKITDRDGRSLTLTYDASSGTLSSVTNDFGRSLTFTRNTSNNQIQSVRDNVGNVWSYNYDSGTTRLISVVSPDGLATVYHYEGSFNAYVITGWGYTPAGGTESRYSSFTYNQNNVVTESHLAGNTNSATFTHNSDGSVVVNDQLSSAGMRSRTFAFTVNQGVALLSSVSGPCASDCSVKSASYDGNGNALTTTDYNGVVTAHTYDTGGQGLETQRVVASGKPEQITQQIDWNTALRLPAEMRLSDASGHVVRKTDWIYNAAGQVLAHCEIDPLQAASYSCSTGGTPPAGVRRTTYTYCNTVDTTQCPVTGLLLAVDGPRTDVSDITHYTYYLTTDESGCGAVGGACHRAGDLYQATDALGHVSTMVAYDKNGRLIRSQDSNSVITDLTYTPRGWLHTRSTGGATTTIDYDPTGTVHKITDPDGVYVTYTYDAAHRLTDITDALGNHIHYTLDAAGNKTQEDTYDSGNTLRRTLSRSFNTLGQLTGVTDGLSHTVFNASYSDSYDANGNLVHTADGLGIQRKQGYDALNRLVSTIDNYNGTDTATQNTQATFAYDALDNLEGVTDPDGLSTTYDYDGLSNPKALHSPDTGTSSFQTDAAGNRIQQTDAKGIVRTTTYDAINRPVTVSYPDSTQNIAYHYDEADSITGCSGSFPNGRLTRIVETAVTTTYCYDSHGNVTRKSQAQGSQVDVTSYTYTAADRLSSITTPSQTVTQYSLNAAGGISSVTVTPSGGASQSVVSAISYLPFGPISGYTLGNGQTISRSYDANYQLTDLTSPALNLHFARDAMGNITGLSSTAGGSPVETYGYDPLYRLAAVDDATGAAIEAYTYSKTGDRLSKAKAGGLATGAYGYQSGSHWLTSIGSAARTYDLNGNTIGSANAGETLGYGFNDRNRLTLVQRNQQTVATYVYNAMGERMAKAVTSPQLVSERFAYDEASQLVGEYGTTNRDYIWLGSLPVAVIDNGTTSAVSYVHADGLSTPRAISDAAGNTIWQWVYQSNPFGELQPTGGYVYNLRFAGQYYDAEKGSMYNIRRDYEAASGRYVQSDAIGLNGGASTFGYVGQNPMTYVDPLGLARHRPDSLYCQRLAARIAGVANDLDKRWVELELNNANNGKGLPEYIGPGERDYQTRRGHRRLIDKADRNYRDLQDQYDNECGPPPPPLSCPQEQLEPRPSFPVVPVAPLAAAPAEAAGAEEALEITAAALELLFAE